MEFFTGSYKDKKLGPQGILEEEEPFIMGIFDSLNGVGLNCVGLKNGRIIDRFDSAQLTGIVNENEMHFVKIYDKYRNSLKVTSRTIQYDLIKTKEGIYSGGYIINPPWPDIPPSGSCIIQKISNEGTAEEIVAEWLKCNDEEMTDLILKKIFKLIN